MNHDMNIPLRSTLHLCLVLLLLKVHCAAVHLSSPLQSRCPSSGHGDNVMPVLGFLFVCADGTLRARVLCALSTQPQPKSRRISLPVAATLTFDLCTTLRVLSLRLTYSYIQLLTRTRMLQLSWISASVVSGLKRAAVGSSLTLSHVSLSLFLWLD